MGIKDDTFIELARYEIFPEHDKSLDVTLPTHRGRELTGQKKNQYLRSMKLLRQRRTRTRRQRRHNRAQWNAYLESRKW
jgi:hypothetical protein